MRLKIETEKILPISDPKVIGTKLSISLNGKKSPKAQLTKNTVWSQIRIQREGNAQTHRTPYCFLGFRWSLTIWVDNFFCNVNLIILMF